MTNFFQDLRYSLRQLRRSPGFAFTVVLTLALSVGVATAVFCVIDAVILRPLPFVDQDRLVSLESRSASGYTQPASWLSYLDERAQTTTFKELAGYFRWHDSAMDLPSGPVVPRQIRTSDNFFRVFGVNALIGRTFAQGEEQEGRNRVVVLSYEAWQKHFDGASSVIGQTVRLDGVPYVVIGAMPPGFRFPLNTRDAIYTPMDLTAAKWMQGRGSHWLRTVGKLKDGVRLQQAQADMSRVFANLGLTYKDTDAGRTVHVTTLTEDVSQKSNGPLWTLLGAVFAVLAIGCVNIAGLLLARGVKREREMAMRVAVGAARQRLLAQLLTEGVMLALIGAAGGIALSWVMLRIAQAFLAHALARGADVHLNWTVLGASIAVAVTASLIASLYPALRLSGVDPNRALKSGGSTGTERSQHRLRSGFVIAQVALTLVLLVVAGLLLRVVSRYRHAEFGFDAAHLMTADLHVTPGKYSGQDMVAELFRPLEDRLSRAPGIAAAGVIDLLPIDSWGSNSEIHIAGQPPYAKNQEMLAENRIVSDGYFAAMQIPLHGGRALSPGLDGSANKAATVVVNDAFVHKFLPMGYGASVVRLDDNDKPEEKTMVVGVVGNVRQDIYEAPLAEMDYLIDEIPVKDQSSVLPNMELVVRTKGDPLTVVPEVRQILRSIDPSAALNDPRSMTEVISETLIFERMESWLFGIFAGLALVLAMVGLYGLISHEVELGTRDIGVRMALGATRSRILTTVLVRVAWMVGAGAVAGLMLTILVRKLIGVVIYFEAQKEWAGFLLLALLVAMAGLIAALVPAARAASTEPMQALRSE